MHGLSDYEHWKQRAEELRREAALARLAKQGRQRLRWMPFLKWELRRYAGRLSKLLRG